MKTEKEIREQIKWFKSELDGVNTGTILCENKIAAQKYCKGCINSLKWVLDEEQQ